MRTTLLALLASLALAAPAHAGEYSGGGSVLIGSGAAFDGDPATFRISLRGELGLVGGEVLNLSALVPVTWTTAGDDAFGISTNQSLLEIPVSARLRAFGAAPVRIHGDLGLGPAWYAARTDLWVVEGSTQSSGWMSRAALGVEIGDPDGGWFGVIEPMSLSRYQFGDTAATRYGFMIGIGGRG